MDKETELKKIFQFTSLVTDAFPTHGSRVLDLGARYLLGNALLFKTLQHQARKQLAGVKKFERILVASDLNIGDAIIGQGAVAAVREIFPDATIDCVVKKSAKDLILGNPEISTLYPLYVGAPFPEESDLAGLARIADCGDYDLVVNFSPMVDDRTFGKRNVVNYSMMAAELVRNESRPSSVVNNVVYQSYKFIGTLFHDILPGDFGRNFRGADVYLSEEAIGGANDFLLSEGISRDDSIVMVNPDASAKFTRMPFDFQRKLLRRLAEEGYSVLLGSGHVEKFIEHELVYSLAPDHRKKITIIPASTQLDVYAALIDLSDVFISGDTGPLHVAAARKFARRSGKSLRNRTAVLSVFGATPSRIYGYDSKAPGFLPANQDAPSKAFVAQTHCRNITCINKMAKTCKEVRCFGTLDPEDVVFEVTKNMEAARKIFQRDRLRILVK